MGKQQRRGHVPVRRELGNRGPRTVAQRRRGPEGIQQCTFVLRAAPSRQRRRRHCGPRALQPRGMGRRVGDTGQRDRAQRRHVYRFRHPFAAGPPPDLLLPCPGKFCATRPLCHAHDHAVTPWPRCLGHARTGPLQPLPLLGGAGALRPKIFWCARRRRGAGLPRLSRRSLGERAVLRHRRVTRVALRGRQAGCDGTGGGGDVRRGAAGNCGRNNFRKNVERAERRRNRGQQ
mmetsp:Transcript_48867/g.95542  ORF Transcript_48867/g.95542 Transcript_48867/m.95542 type:complete len:232 (+) Transcript_48867:1993-2688(+)